MPELGASIWWPARPMRCKPAATLGGRLNLHHQVDGPHVDAQLERAGGHQAAHLARLERLLNLQPLRPGDGAVVGPDQGLPGQVVERDGETLRAPPVVDEEQGRGVRAHQLQETGMDGAPDGGPGRPRARGLLGLRPTRAMSSTGTSMRRESALRAPASTRVTGLQAGDVSRRGELASAARPSPVRPRRAAAATAPGATGRAGTAPPRKRATSSSGRWVAERPMRWRGRPVRASSRSRLRRRWAPRLVGRRA